MKQSILFSALMIMALCGCVRESKVDNPAFEGDPDFLESHA